MKLKFAEKWKTYENENKAKNQGNPEKITTPKMHCTS